MPAINLNSVANDLSFFAKSKNGTKVFKGIGEKGEQIVASMKPGETSPSFAVVKHAPKTSIVVTKELNSKRFEDTNQLIDVLKKDAEPQYIIKNSSTENYHPDHTHYMTINELTGRAISRDIYRNNPGFNETQMIRLSDFKRID